ncbi:hypothetical protein HNR08_003455 [Cellulomonas hominis]|uniref:Uncharacterized protein n=1 Tax=Cellulomonas hominis TaxID=156981 RepID=A0A7W8SH66_9CELL|nr:hypothetical protein [Cellulomonas hominis]MBB5474719.1 hypothetical protein [Cellulomonas hominis]
MAVQPEGVGLGRRCHQHACVVLTPTEQEHLEYYAREHASLEE